MSAMATDQATRPPASAGLDAAPEDAHEDALFMWRGRGRKVAVAIDLGGSDKLAGVLSRLEQRRCRLEQPRDPRSMGLFRRLVREALPKIAVENGGPNLKQKMSALL